LRTSAGHRIDDRTAGSSWWGRVQPAFNGGPLCTGLYFSALLLIEQIPLGRDSPAATNRDERSADCAQGQSRAAGQLQQAAAVEMQLAMISVFYCHGLDSLLPGTIPRSRRYGANALDLHAKRNEIA
jgi:hypothetical protein